MEKMKYYVKELNNQNHYKKKNLEFDYIKPNDFEKLEEKTVLGSIQLKETNSTKVDTVVIESNDCTFNFELLEEKNPKSVLGYVLVEDNIYIAVKKKNILIPIIIAFVVIGIIIWGIFISTRTNDVIVDDTPDLEFEDGTDWNGELPQNGEQSKANAESIEIPGYADLFVSTENPEIQLINPEGNTVYFVYSIYEEDKLIYETKAIEPNKMVSVNLKEILSTGEHKLSFAISTYDIKTQNACNGANQEVNVTVKE